MGLLYVDGARVHDDESELLERLSRAERRGGQMRAQIAADGEVYADIFDPRDGSQSGIIAAMRAWRKARSEQI